MENKRLRKNTKIRTVLITGIFLLTSPLMIAAVVFSAPPADSTIIYAADASARLAAGDIFNRFDISDVNKGNFNDNNNVKYANLSLDNTASAPLNKTKASLLFIDDRTMLSFGVLDIPSSSNEELIVDDSSVNSGPKPYPTEIESHDGTIINMQYGYFQSSEYINLAKAGQIRNVTSVSNEILIKESEKLPEFTIEKNGEPQILIMHTHTTESFEPYERDFYDSSFSSRTTDERMNVVAVGNAMQKELENAGIAVVHDTEMYDYPSYNGSYDRSRESIKKYLEEYPSIKIVLDVHRDAIEREDGTRIAPVTEINGKNAAQVMIICCCDDGSNSLPNYLQNFRFASLLQGQLEYDYNTLTRPVLFDYRKYNQDLTTGSLLIEVGGHANSIDQATYSGELIGKSLVNALS